MPLSRAARFHVLRIIRAALSYRHRKQLSTNLSITSGCRAASVRPIIAPKDVPCRCTLSYPIAWISS